MAIFMWYDYCFENFEVEFVRSAEWSPNSPDLVPLD